MKVPRGLHTHRLVPQADCPREVAMTEAWEKYHERTDLLGTLFQVPCNKGDDGARYAFGQGYAKDPLGEPTERDRIVAATVFQWIGSNCGLFTVTEALERCGYAVVTKQSLKKHFYAEANARLIAAAADLLAACHLALKFWYSDQPNDTPESVVAKHAIRDAINKAEGE
jgi:hypothetical protein